MKILPVAEIRKADAYTIENEPIASIELMERAAEGLCKWFVENMKDNKNVMVFCGMGNNGGDGLALSRLLLHKGYDVQTFLVHHSENMSPDCERNHLRLLNETEIGIQDIFDESDFPEVSDYDVVVDAIFGSGLSRPVAGVAAELIKYLNNVGARRIAIDMPSGLFADVPLQGPVAFKADVTLTLQFPKLSFLFPENGAYVGDFEVIDIGLHPDFIRDVVVGNFFVERDMLKPLLRPRGRFSHKGTYGHALLVAGSSKMTGAAILASKACLRTGVGLLTTHVPQKAVLPLQVSLPEAIVDADVDEDINTIMEYLNPYSAIGVGPGMGQDDVSARLLKRIIQDAEVPLVLDADALNILGSNPTWIAFLPSKTILTPHPKEFERMFGKTTNSFERLALQRSMSVKHGIVIVLKGAYTSVTLPNGTCFFNSTGNPGMATAGSGDVLTGMVLSLLAQGYAPEEAAVMGVYLHGIAGDSAALESGYESLIAGDIVDNIGQAFAFLRS